MKKSPVCDLSHAVALLFWGLAALLCHAAPPPYSSVSVVHTTERDMFLQAAGGSLYDPDGLVNGANGDLFHSSMAYTLGWIGDANCRVDDTMYIPFSVTRSDYYDVNVSGTVSVGIYNVGENAFLGSHWGDFSVSIRDASIRDLTTGSVIYSGFSRNIYYSKTSLWAALEPAVWGSVELLLEQYFPLVAANKYIEAGLKLKEIFDTLDSISNAKQTITTNYTASAAVYLEAGHTYRIEPHIDSTVAASSVDLIAGGHFSGVKGTLHISDFSVVSRTPNYTLSVQSSGASGVSITASPADVTGTSSGVTTKTFTYLSGSGVSLSAPSTVGTKVFSGWSGVDNQNGTTVFLTMNANRTATALYSDTSVTVTIATPTTSPTWPTASDRIFLHGTASSFVTNVSWQNTSTGESETASGTTAWATSGITLSPGSNTITVTARDAGDRTASDSITVNYDISTREVIVAPSAGTFVMSGTPSKNFGPVDLDIGYSAYVGEYNLRGLVHYSLNQVPPGSTISSARVGLYNRQSTPTSAPVMTVHAYRLTQSWSQSGVNWANQPSHTTSGGVSLPVGNATGWYYWDVSSMVQGWWAGTLSNFGLKLISSVEGGGSDNIRSFGGVYYSRNPQLRVVYIPEKVLPVVTIASPTSGPAIYYTNSTPLIPLGGTSSDNYTVSSVVWTNSTASQGGAATGTTAWNADVALTEGWNSVSITATDSVGNLGTDAINIFYVTPDVNAPTVPSGTTATALSTTQAKVAWNASSDTGGSGFEEYSVYRNGLLRTNTQFLSFTDTGLMAFSNYCYTITAVDNAGNQSAQSPAACVATALPAAPSLALVGPKTTSPFSFSITCSTGYTYVMECSSDLQSWTYLMSLAVTNSPFILTFTNSSGLPRNFYRAKFVP